jgi:hypothetical protein
MQPDFSAKGHRARELIAVPDLSMGLIRSRSHAAAAQARARSLAVCGAIVLATLGAGAALSGKIHGGLNVWLSGDKASMVVRSFEIMVEPTAPDVHSAIAHATFPIVFPIGLPNGTRVTAMTFAPAVHPNAITVMYANKSAHFHVGVDLFDSTAVGAGDPQLPSGAVRGQVYRWQIGGETVVIPMRSVSAREAASIEKSMLKTTVSDSLAVTDTMLAKITMLDQRTFVGGPSALADSAARIAPVTGRTVLFGGQTLDSIPRLVKQGKPILDDRIAYLTNIPTVRGSGKYPGPNYSKATYRWPKNVVVSPGGVRAINAVLQSTGAATKCGCEILFNQPNSATYRVWTISVSSPATVKKYAVDAKTLTVTRSR